MSLTSAEILELLLEGIHPTTGEIFPEDHVCNDPYVIRALHCAIRALNTESPSSDCSYTTRSGRLNAGRSWTKEDDSQLRDLFVQGTPIEDICLRLHRRKRGVMNRLNHLKLIQQEEPVPENAGTVWRAKDDEKLRDMFHQGLPLEEISGYFKRTPGAIRSRMVRLGLIEHRWQYADGEPPWTQHDTELLRALYEDGISLSLIAARFNRSEKAIRARLFYMGMIKEAPEMIPKRK